VTPASSAAAPSAHAHAPIVHHKSGDASSDAKTAAPESAAAILAKNRFWRAALSREPGWGENFFIAKSRDSESTQSPFNRHRRTMTSVIAHRSLDDRIVETLVAQLFLEISIIASAIFHARFASSCE
jgi:hypothetical protein